MKPLHLLLAAMLALLPAMPSLAATAGQFQSNVAYDVTATVVIGTSTTVTPAVDLKGTRLVGIFVPSTFDGTAMTLSASPTIDGTFVPVDIDHTSSSAYTITTAASKYVPIANTDLLAGLRFIKITTGTAQSTTDTVFTLATKP